MGQHIAYLRPTCRCHASHVGSTRVAVLNAEITPLHLFTDSEIPSWDDRAVANYEAVIAAVEALHAAALQRAWVAQQKKST